MAHVALEGMLLVYVPAGQLAQGAQKGKGKQVRTGNMVCAQLAEARAKREVITAKMAEVLGDDGVLTIPTTPGPAPLLNMEYKALEDYRSNALQLTCIAGNSRLPQACAFPWGYFTGAVAIEVPKPSLCGQAIPACTPVSWPKCISESLGSKLWS